MPFHAGGPLARKFPHYEERPQQQQMADLVTQAIEEKSVALIEAGTGTGKTLAYLAPALQSGKRVVVSTHTIPLQEQLMGKDLPLLLDALELDLEAVLVKGMGNYVCLRRLDDAMVDSGSLSSELRGELEEIGDWAAKSEDGSKADLDFSPHPSVWDRVAAEGDACSGGRCPHFKRCPFFAARDRAEDAQLLVVNHHLLLSDLALKSEGESGILPDYDVVILDEAHHLEQVATQVFARGSSRSELLRLLTKLQGRLSALLEKLAIYETPAKESLLVTLPAAHARLSEQATYTFEQLRQLADREGSHRLREGELPADPMEALIEQTEAMAKELRTLLKVELPDICRDATRSIRLDIEALTGRLDRHGELYRSLQSAFTPDEVRSIAQRGAHNTRVEIAPLNVAQLLQERLFEQTATVVLTGATLTTAGHFDYLKSRLGLSHSPKPLVEAVYPSPFDYTEQALFLVSTHLPPPTDPGYLEEALESLVQVLTHTGGGAFVLFTSFQMLRSCHQALAERLPFPLLVQGDGDRAALLQRFRESGDAVLLGTDSFWEGVDVVGDALRSVVIMRLPFRVPTEPILQARAESIDQGGGSSFFDYVVPQAIVKFKQGFGRLIRSRRDRGCVICLDSRIARKSYGRLFLKSLPPEAVPFANLEELSSHLNNWSVAESNR